MATPTEVVTNYLKAWKAKDFTTMRAILADDLQFAGPIDAFDNADAHQEAIQGLSQVMDDLVITKLWADGPDVLAWYELHTQITDPAPVAEWYHVKGETVTKMHVVFNAAAFAPPS